MAIQSVSFEIAILLTNKPAAKAAGQTLPDATPQVGKIQPFSNIALTFQSIQFLDAIQEIESLKKMSIHFFSRLEAPF